ncbi:MAG: LysE family translocator [Kineosporiaceae bacterium]|nr:LysE family translocator [Kineosporiaceae bacterium]MBK8076430.1 LysE family translocator [Kineosporiaceae bacterium]
MPIRLPAFVATCWLLAMVPGAGQALMLRQALAGGPRLAWISIAGTCTGLLIWSTTAAGGLSALLLANPSAYAVLRVGGGLVLAVLGVNSLRAMWRSRRSEGSSTARDESTQSTTDRPGAYLAGLATNLGNPKAGVFAISLIPQFIAPRGYVFASGVMLGAVWALTTSAWYVVFVGAVERGRALVTRPAVDTWLHGLTGVVLLVLGGGVAFAL